MALPHGANHEKLAEVALALLHLTSYQEGPATRAWKGLDWDLLNLLHEKGWISDPKNKNKSVILTEEGAQLAERFFEHHFVRT